MSGDYTRFTFKPLKDYSGLFKQQGRVDLDSDFNELIEIIDRRWRSETIDIFGHCVVCDVAGTPSEAFQILPTALGTFDIGIGRMYVDGIQVENHGRVPLQYLPDLGEHEGTVRTLYSDQPYLPLGTPPLLTPIPAPRTDLIYIDAWQREVTVLEDPSIREIALGGPDTTTRIQSAWQVRALQNVGQHGCGDDIAAWNALVAPSAGRLTTSAVAPPTSDDPCIISPSGGYRGLENRLYRVEIHSPGTIGGGGPAKFKWSRNNASIVSTVSAIDAVSLDNVIVQQVGRDEVLRFETGNFIEITDDFHEFQGQAGHMARITNIDQANRIITFTPAIPATAFDTADPESRHTRVLRWDQTLNVDANGLLDVVAGSIPIEDGVEVQFSLDPAGGNFKVGDYWVFCARTADGSVEPLTNAPPRGILHHFCRLGFVHWGADLASTTFDDCRNHWPPACECDAACTVTVGDGIDSHGQFTDIQQAINALGTRGGVVCIGRGFYRVTAPLLVDATKRNVRIVGTGPATRIVFDPAGANRVFLRMRNTEHVSLEKVFVASVNAQSLIEITNSSFCRVEDCILVNLSRESDRTSTPGAIEFREDCRNCEILGNAMLAFRVVTGLGGNLIKLLIRDNQMMALQVSVLLGEAFGVEIVHNQMRGLTNKRPTFASPTRDTIDEFQVLVSNMFRAVTTPGDFQAAGIVIFAGASVVISQNLIVAQAAIVSFLFLNARILQNDIVSLIGVLLIFEAVVKIEDNFILGLLFGVIHAGFGADHDCTSNEFLGLNGIIWMSLGDLIRAVAAILAIAIESADLGDGDAAVNNTLAGGGRLAFDQSVFGVALMEKVHRNVFLTLAVGIAKTPSVISADVSIVDNTFTVCAFAGIVLASTGSKTERLTRFLGLINLRHLIQSNAFAVFGRGVLSNTPFTLVEQNSIQCPSVAIELDAGFCSARNNSITGFSQDLAPHAEGLIVLHNGAVNIVVAGNSLRNAPGHAILIREDLTDITIHDNNIRGARRFGIGGFNEAIEVSRADIQRNHVERCQGEVPDEFRQGRGAVSIVGGADVRFIGNTITHNAPAPGPQQNWAAVQFEAVDGIEFSENLVIENGTVEGITGQLGAVALQAVQGIIRVQNNVIRGNGGIGLRIEAAVQFVGTIALVRGRTDEALVQNNHIFAGPNLATFLVLVSNIDMLSFQGNQCVEGAGSPFQGLPGILLRSVRGNVNGNMVDLSRRISIRVDGSELVVNANSVRTGTLLVSNSRFIVTSNMTSSLSTPPIGPNRIRAHNIPPP